MCIRDRPRPSCPPRPSSRRPKPRPEMAAAAEFLPASAAVPNPRRSVLARRWGARRQRSPPVAAAEVRRQAPLVYWQPLQAPGAARLLALARMRLLARRQTLPLARVLRPVPAQSRMYQPEPARRLVAAPVRRTRQVAEPRKWRYIACERAPASGKFAPAHDHAGHSIKGGRVLCSHAPRDDVQPSDCAEAGLTIPSSVFNHAHKSRAAHARAAAHGRRCEV